LCQQITETPRLVQVLWGLWYFYFARADHQAARDVAEQCMAVARKLQQQVLLVQASFILGGSQLLVGDLTTSRESLDCSIRSYDRQLHSGLRLELLQYGQDPEVSALCPMALVYWHLGYPDRAVESVLRAKTLARALSHHIARPLHSASRAGFVYTAARRASMRKLRRQRYPFQPDFHYLSELAIW
jgi:hypothetical protein